MPQTLPEPVSATRVRYESTPRALAQVAIYLPTVALAGFQMAQFISQIVDSKLSLLAPLSQADGWASPMYCMPDPH